MNQYNECLPCPSYCPYCTDPLNCILCESGYYLSSGTCKECSTKNGYSCDSGIPNECTVCNHGYHLTSGKSCVACPQNCDICSDTHICSTCSSGFHVNSDGICSPCTLNCAECTNDDTCSVCNDGYFIQSSIQKCLQCPSECATCHAYGTCTACINGYYLGKNGGLPSYQCEKCKFPCSTCTEEEDQCLSC